MNGCIYDGCDDSDKNIPTPSVQTFLHNHELLSYLSSFLDAFDLGIFDSAICNRELRPVWLKCLGSIDVSNSVDRFEHDAASFNWVIKRQIRVKKVSFIYSEEFQERNLALMKSIFQEGFQLPTLVDVSLRYFQDIDEDDVSALCRGCPNLTTLDLSRCHYLTGNSLYYIGHSCPNLKIFDMTFCGHLGSHFGYIAVGCKALQRLVLECCQVNDEYVDEYLDGLNEYCPNLQFIDLSLTELSDASITSLVGKSSPLQTILLRYTDLTDEGLRKIAEACPDLRKLDISDCRNISSVGLVMVASKCPLLESLIIENVEVEGIADGLLAILQRCPKLGELHMSQEFERNDDIGQLLYHVGQLNLTLELQDVDLNGCMFDANSLPHFARSCPKLRKLVLGDCAGVDDADLLSLAQNCIAMEEITLRLLPSITCAGLVELCKACRHLQSVTIVRCSGISNEGIRSLANCTQLTKLILDSVENIDEASLYTIARSLHNLEWLSVLKCGPCMTDNVTSEFARNNPKLKSLFLDGPITDVGLTAIAAGCRQLEVLDLQQCANLTDEGIVRLSECCRDLREFSLSEMQNITASGMRALASRCRRLRGVIMNGPGISETDFVKLVTAFPRVHFYRN